MKNSMKELLFEKAAELQKVNRIDRNVGFANWVNYTIAANPPIGQCIVRHTIAKDTMVRINKIIELNLDTSKEEDTEKICEILTPELIAVWKRIASESLAAPSMWDAVFSEDTSAELTGSDVHENIEYKVVKFEDVKETLVRLSKLNLDLSDIQSLKDIADAFMRFSRFFSEQIIDATKTADDVNIPYHRALGVVKYSSRQMDEDHFNVIPSFSDVYEDKEIKPSSDFQDGVKWYHRFGVKYTVPSLNDKIHKNEDGSVKQIYLADSLGRIRHENTRPVVQAAAMLGKQSQEVAPEMKAAANATAAQFSELVPPVSLSKQIYMTVSTASAVLKKNTRLKYADASRGVQEAHMKLARDFYRPAYTALHEMTEGVLEDLNPVQRSEVAFSVCLHDKEDREDLSSFNQDILGEDFVHHVLNANLPGVHSVDYIQEPLYSCTLNEGYAEFVNGEAHDEDGNSALAEEEIGGKFYVRKDENGRWYAYKSVTEVLDEKAAKKKASSKSLIFVSKFTEEDSLRAEAAQKKLASGKQVHLVPYSSWNKGLRDSVVVDNEEIIKFRCSLDNEVSPAINNLYGWKTGEVTFCTVVETTGKDRYGNIVTRKVLICVLSNVRKSNANFKNVKLLPATPVRSSNGRRTCNGFGTKMEQASAPSAPRRSCNGFGSRME